MKENKNIIAAAIIAIGLIAMGWCLSSGLEKGLSDERYVTVKGLSERIVPADKVVWPLVFKEVGNDLETVANNVNKKNQAIVNYLTERGIPKEEISVEPPEINDLQTDIYRNEYQYRYNIQSIITVTSSQVDLVRELIAKQGELLDMGIALATNDYQWQVNYIFSGLNELKPDMIAEATRNARTAAEQFATDSDSKLGKIKTASQGQFSIESRDEYTPYEKRIRVVTSVVYYLKD